MYRFNATDVCLYYECDEFHQFYFNICNNTINRYEKSMALKFLPFTRMSYFLRHLRIQIASFLKF